MHDKTWSIGKRYILRGAILVLLLVFFCAGTAAAKLFTIGIITNVEIHEQTIAGFKHGMSTQGYSEGRDVRYIYHGVVHGDIDAIDAEIEKLLSEDVDLFLTMANRVSLRVKMFLEGSGTPILIAGSSRPIEEGLLESLGRPGGDITGVRVADNFAKTLEWLTATLPDARTVLIPYNPADSVSMVSLAGLEEKADKLGLELLCYPVRSIEDALVVIKNPPKGVDAVFRIPSPTLDLKNESLSRAAIARGLPMISCLALDDKILMTFSADLYRAGEQTARLAHLIRNGAKPSELPVETCDADLTINLKTASELGIDIPDEILLQAKTIIRE